MSGSFDAKGNLDIADGRIINCFGRKGSGKSIMGTLLFRSYPGDRVVLDIAGDDGPWGPGVIELKGDVTELPRRWPESQRKDKERMTLRYVPDFKSPTLREDMDAVVGMVMAHGDCCILVHEIGHLALPSSQCPPHTRELLMHNRHRKVTAIFCGPRPAEINTLVYGQANVIYIFDVPAPQDREKLGQFAGWNVKSLHEGVSDLREHEYLRFDANEPKPETEDDPDMRMVHFPPLPEDVVSDTKKWAHGGVK